MYKVLDHDTNEHVIFESYDDACIFKGVNPKAAYKVKRNTKDRPKDYKSGSLVQYGLNNAIKAYVLEWLKLNKLAA
jgi:hypothetical protein